MYRILSLLLLCSLFVYGAFAQTDSSRAAQNDTLPFVISKVKRLSDEDLANKKEGVSFAGVPELSSDPINGFGVGVEGSIIFNGKKSDPFYAYTPYKMRLDVVGFYTTNKQRELALNLDIPYIFRTKWRLRASAALEANPNLLYFGNTERSLHGLQTLSQMDGVPQTPFSGNSYESYNKALTGNNYNYNRYIKNESILNVSAEYALLQSRMRVLVGYELAGLNIQTFQGNSRLRQDYNANKIVGVGKSLISMFQAGIVYDTRDLEPDPSKGIFAEITDEFSNGVFGSQFNFNKTFGQIKVYHKVLPGIFSRMIFAGRYGLGYTAGNAPFYEYQDEWSSEGSIEGLGGGTTLRGYKQSRFLGRVMDFANFELRTRFAQAKILKQHFAFSAVPFADVGGVWNNFQDFSKFANYRGDGGLGLRIAWNVNTILSFDYAVSHEDHQFFFHFGQAF